MVEQSYPLMVQRQKKEEGAEVPPTVLFEEAELPLEAASGAHL